MSAVNEHTVTTQDKDEAKSAVGSNSGQESKSEINPLEEPSPTNPKSVVDEPARPTTTEESASKATAVEDVKSAPSSWANPQIATQEQSKPIAVWGQPDPSASGSKQAEHEDGEEGAKGEDPSVSPRLFHASIAIVSTSSTSVLVIS